MAEDKPRVVVRMPMIGENTGEGVVRFLKKPGEFVKRDEPVAEVDLDKVSIELGAPEDGTIESLMVEDSAVVAVDGPLYVLRPGAYEPGQERPVAATVPRLATVSFGWDPSHVRARARAIGETLAAEAALIVTALMRAIAAVPAWCARNSRCRRAGSMSTPRGRAGPAARWRSTCR